MAGRLAKARESLKALGPLSDHGAQLVHQRVFGALDPGDDPDDMPTIEMLLEFSPRDLESRYRAGRYHLQRGDFEKAAEYLEIFESVTPNNQFRPSARTLLEAVKRGN